MKTYENKIWSLGCSRFAVALQWFFSGIEVSLHRVQSGYAVGLQWVCSHVWGHFLA